jgi:hypothetical protein
LLGRMCPGMGWFLRHSGNSLASGMPAIAVPAPY